MTVSITGQGRGRIRASCVAFAGHGVLILGASGTGKSALALELMSRGARLVSDDQTDLKRRADTLIASAPPAIAGRIEARFVGILRAEALPEVPVALAVDLDAPDEENRLPLRRSANWLGVNVSLLHNVRHAYFPAAILQLLKAGRTD